VGRADALVVDLAVMVAALLAGEDLHRLVLRADGIEALARLAQGNLLVAVAVQHQEGTRNLLHDAVELERLEVRKHLILRLHVEHPGDMLVRNGKRRRVGARQALEALAPDLLVVPLRPPGEAAGKALLEGRRARGVIAAEADRHYADALRIDLGPRGE